MRSAVLYTMDQYGMEGYKALVEGSKVAGVCFTSTVPVPLSGLSDADYQVRNLFVTFISFKPFQSGLNRTLHKSSRSLILHSQ